MDTNNNEWLSVPDVSNELVVLTKIHTKLWISFTFRNITAIVSIVVFDNQISKNQRMLVIFKFNSARKHTTQQMKLKISFLARKDGWLCSIEFVGANESRPFTIKIVGITLHEIGICSFQEVKGMLMAIKLYSVCSCTVHTVVRHA